MFDKRDSHEFTNKWIKFSVLFLNSLLMINYESKRLFVLLKKSIRVLVANNKLLNANSMY